MVKPVRESEYLRLLEIWKLLGKRNPQESNFCWAREGQDIFNLNVIMSYSNSRDEGVELRRPFDSLHELKATLK